MEGSPAETPIEKPDPKPCHVRIYPRPGFQIAFNLPQSSAYTDSLSRWIADRIPGNLLCRLLPITLWPNSLVQGVRAPEPWGELFSELQKMPGGMFLMASAIAERAEQNFPSKGYRSYFEAQGFAPFLARGLGSLTISGGKRQAKEAKRVAPSLKQSDFSPEAMGNGAPLCREPSWCLPLAKKHQSSTSCSRTRAFTRASSCDCCRR